MAGTESGKAVVAAIAGNGIISVGKLAVFAVTGSGAMLAEGIHSVADTANQFLLWVGIRKSHKPADDAHPYGYGAERYVWALISAMGIFFLGCGVTCYHGVHAILHPKPVEAGWLTWTVLGVSALVEGYVLLLAVLEANRQRGEKSFLRFMRESSDPTLIAVLFEDSIAVLGVFIASGAIFVAQQTGWYWLDGAASLTIGLLLGLLALILAAKNKQLLIGHSATPEIEERVRRIALSHPSVAEVLSVRTRVIAAGENRVDLQVDFDPNAMIDRWREDIRSKASSITDADALETFSRDLAAKLLDELANEVDQLEAEIQEAVPSATLIDVEGD